MRMASSGVSRGREQGRGESSGAGSIFIKGPEAVLDRFIAYTNDLGVDAYRQALEKLLNEKDK